MTDNEKTPEHKLEYRGLPVPDWFMNGHIVMPGPAAAWQEGVDAAMDGSPRYLLPAREEHLFADPWVQRGSIRDVHAPDANQIKAAGEKISALSRELADAGEDYLKLKAVIRDARQAAGCHVGETVRDALKRTDRMDVAPILHQIRKAVGWQRGEATYTAVQRVVRQRDELQAKFNQAGIDLARQAETINEYRTLLKRREEELKIVTSERDTADGYLIEVRELLNTKNDDPSNVLRTLLEDHGQAVNDRDASDNAVKAISDANEKLTARVERVVGMLTNIRRDYERGMGITNALMTAHRVLEGND